MRVSGKKARVSPEKTRENDRMEASGVDQEIKCGKAV
jgi:hypothetical protein